MPGSCTLIGQRLAHYEIVELLGQGGMGQVYLARDGKLDREVALKLLPPDLGRDPERLARFRREAKVLASLNHPNIAGIHGLEEDQGHLFLVMELAPGEDLSGRIARGPMAVDEVVHVARRLAEGLEQAHERGVVHRDLKPANVKLADDGTLKILDFGLARAYAGESAAEEDIGTSPTITAAMTQAGTILGTAAYMSPEQARGKEVDRRADIWAFGVILFELLTGRRLFDGETISDTLADVLKTEPDFDRLPAATPPALRWLIERCLQKSSGQRLRDIGEARVLLESELGEAPLTTNGVHTVVESRTPRWVPTAMFAAAIVALALGWFLGGANRGPGPAPIALHAALLAPVGYEFALDSGGHFAISPDARRLVFAARDTSDVVSLWVRRLDRPSPYALTGTERASYPFWSPDSQTIGFFADGRLRKIDADGGVATTICPAPNGRGATWLTDDTIIFAFEVRDALQRVSASGGTPVTVTAIDSMGWSHRWPQVMPDQRHFVYLQAGPDDQFRWASLEAPTEHTVLLGEVDRPQYANGHLFFGRDGALWARPFDPSAGTFLGPERLVVESVLTSQNFDRPAYSVATDGSLVYVEGAEESAPPITVHDAEGRRTSTLDLGGRTALDLDLAPDGRRLAMSLQQTDSEPDVWIYDLERGTLDRFTRNESADDPRWSPDGSRIVYSRENRTLVLRSTVGRREVLGEYPVSRDMIPHDWSPDGNEILLTDSGDGRSIIVLPLDDPDAKYELVRSDTYKTHAQYSPDGRWVAYMEVSSGDTKVFLRSSDPDGGVWPVTARAAVQPRFTADGRRLVFVTDRGLASVEVALDGEAPVFGAEQDLVDLPIAPRQSNTHQYVFDDALERILIESEPSSGYNGSMPIHLVMNWRDVTGGP